MPRVVPGNDHSPRTHYQAFLLLFVTYDGCSVASDPGRSSHFEAVQRTFESILRPTQDEDSDSWNVKSVAQACKAFEACHTNCAGTYLASLHRPYHSPSLTGSHRNRWAHLCHDCRVKSMQIVRGNFYRTCHVVLHSNSHHRSLQHTLTSYLKNPLSFR